MEHICSHPLFNICNDAYSSSIEERDIKMKSNMKSNMKGYNNPTSPTNFLWGSEEEAKEDGEGEDGDGKEDDEQN